jgi:hypothetical protein
MTDREDKTDKCVFVVICGVAANCIPAQTLTIAIKKHFCFSWAA